MNPLALEQLIVVQLANYINKNKSKIKLPCEIVIEEKESGGEQLTLQTLPGGKIIKQYVDGGYIGNFPFAARYQLSKAQINGEYAKLDAPLWNLDSFFTNRKITFPPSRSGGSAIIQSIQMTGLPYSFSRESDGTASNQAVFNLRYYNDGR